MNDIFLLTEIHDMKKRRQRIILQIDIINRHYLNNILQYVMVKYEKIDNQNNESIYHQIGIL